ncbi:MAG TPA: hypothetical protein VLJ15_01350 [Gammaproteobacteria bacterium]|nr:hypothetical protein [Gammaproteobacteria bacterium]
MGHSRDRRRELDSLTTRGVGLINALADFNQDPSWADAQKKALQDIRDKAKPESGEATLGTVIEEMEVFISALTLQLRDKTGKGEATFFPKNPVRLTSKPVPQKIEDKSATPPPVIEAKKAVDVSVEEEPEPSRSTPGPASGALSARIQDYRSRVDELIGTLISLEQDARQKELVRKKYAGELAAIPGTVTPAVLFKLTAFKRKVLDALLHRREEVAAMAVKQEPDRNKQKKNEAAAPDSLEQRKVLDALLDRRKEILDIATKREFNKNEQKKNEEAAQAYLRERKDFLVTALPKIAETIKKLNSDMQKKYPGENEIPYQQEIDRAVEIANNKGNLDWLEGLFERLTLEEHVNREIHELARLDRKGLEGELPKKFRGQLNDVLFYSGFSTDNAIRGLTGLSQKIKKIRDANKPKEVGHLKKALPRSKPKPDVLPEPIARKIENKPLPDPSEENVLTPELQEEITRLFRQGSTVISQIEGHFEGIAAGVNFSKLIAQSGGSADWKELIDACRLGLRQKELHATDQKPGALLALKNYVAYLETELPGDVKEIVDAAARASGPTLNETFTSRPGLPGSDLKPEGIDAAEAVFQAIDELIALDKELAKLQTGKDISESDARALSGLYEDAWHALSANDKQLDHLTELGGMIETRKEQIATIKTTDYNTRFIMTASNRQRTKEQCIDEKIGIDTIELIRRKEAILNEEQALADMRARLAERARLLGIFDKKETTSAEQEQAVRDANIFMNGLDNRLAILNGSKMETVFEEEPEAKVHVQEVVAPEQEAKIEVLLKKASEIAARIKALNLGMQEGLKENEIPYQDKISSFESLGNLDMAKDFVDRLVLEEKVNAQIHVFANLVHEIPAEKTAEQQKIIQQNIQQRKLSENTLKQALANVTTSEAIEKLNKFSESMEAAISKEVERKKQQSEHRKFDLRLEISKGNTEIMALLARTKQLIHQLIALDVALQAAPDIRVIRENYESPLPDLSTKDEMVEYAQTLGHEITEKKAALMQEEKADVNRQILAHQGLVVTAKDYIGQLVKKEIDFQTRHRGSMTDEAIKAYRERYQGPLPYLTSKVALDKYIDVLKNELAANQHTHALKKVNMKELFEKANRKNEELQAWFENEKIQDWARDNKEMQDWLTITKEQENHRDHIAGLFAICAKSGNPKKLEDFIASMESRLLEYKIQRLRVRIDRQIDQLALRQKHDVKTQEDVREHYAKKLRAIPEDYTADVFRKLTELQQFLQVRVQKYVARPEYTGSPDLATERQAMQTKKQAQEFRILAEPLLKRASVYIAQLADLAVALSQEEEGQTLRKTPAEIKRDVRESCSATMNRMTDISDLKEYVGMLWTEVQLQQSKLDNARPENQAKYSILLDAVKAKQTGIPDKKEEVKENPLEHEPMPENQARRLIEEYIGMQKTAKKEVKRNQLEKQLGYILDPTRASPGNAPVATLEEFIERLEEAIAWKKTKADTRVQRENAVLRHNEKSLFAEAKHCIDQLVTLESERMVILGQRAEVTKDFRSECRKPYENKLSTLSSREDLVSYVKELKNDHIRWKTELVEAIQVAKKFISEIAGYYPRDNNRSRYIEQKMVILRSFSNGTEVQDYVNDDLRPELRMLENQKKAKGGGLFGGWTTRPKPVLARKPSSVGSTIGEELPAGSVISKGSFSVSDGSGSGGKSGLFQPTSQPGSPSAPPPKVGNPGQEEPDAESVLPRDSNSGREFNGGVRKSGKGS